MSATKLFRFPIFLAAISVSTTSLAEDFSLRTTETFYNDARLVDWSGDGNIKFAIPDGASITTPVDKVVRFGIGRQSRAGQGVLLIDGSLLVGRIVRIDQKQCDLSGDYFRTSVPRPLIRSILVHAPGLDGLQSEWLDMASEATGADDLLQTVDGDRITGTITGDADNLIFLAGTLNEIRISDDRRANSGQRVIDWQKIRGIIFSPLLTGMIPESAGTTTLGLVDGSRLTLLNMTANVSGIWRFQLACGLEIRSRKNQFSLDQICYLARSTSDLSSSNIKQVNATDALRIRRTSLFGNAEMLNATAIGAGQGSLRIGVLSGKETGWIKSGLQMSAGTQAVFRLPPRAKRFSAELATGPAQDFTPFQCIVSLVNAAGEIRQAWASKPLASNQGTTLLDVNIRPTEVAMILSVEHIAPSLDTAEAIWIAPLVYTEPVEPAREQP